MTPASRRARLSTGPLAPASSVRSRSKMAAALIPPHRSPPSPPENERSRPRVDRSAPAGALPPEGGSGGRTLFLRAGSVGGIPPHRSVDEHSARKVSIRQTVVGDGCHHWERWISASSPPWQP